MFRPTKQETIERRAQERVAQVRERKTDLRARLAAKAATGDDIFADLLAEFDANNPELKP